MKKTAIKLRDGFVVLLASTLFMQAQDSLSRNQQEALRLLDMIDTSRASEYWPMIDPEAFRRNVKRNILRPEKIYQGHVTNFCGYAALSVILCSQQPQTYVRCMVELYEKGVTTVGGETIMPSETVRRVAGNLEHKGRLNVNPADQLWLMSLPDHFKGYMNMDRKYKPGDENKIWAACTLGKFNRMARVLGGYRTTSYGTDLVRPLGRHNVHFLQEQLALGTLILFVNSKFLHPSKFRLFVLRAPTHYIIIYDIAEVNGVIELKYWDYGLKTVELVSPKRLRKMTFGIVRLNVEKPAL